LRLVGLTGTSGGVWFDDLAGRVTLVNYWGTWCPPCIREFPDIVALAERFGSAEDFRLYAVSCGEGPEPSLGELRAQTTAFLASRAPELPTYADPNGESRRAMTAALGLPGMSYPTTLVLDRHGTVRGFWQGYRPRNGQEMAEVVERLLDEPRPATR
jgi:thiol-disulfide isomerase/thioredoxin